MDSLWNFACMISYAVPSLSKTIKGVEHQVPHYSVPKPDYFVHDKTTLPNLKQLMKGYEKRLSIYLWMSVFSFFEGYITGVMDELIAFHGGKTEFSRNAKNNVFKAIARITPTMKKKIYDGKLHKIYEGKNRFKYKKYTDELVNMRYPFPSTLFAAFGVKMLIEKRNDLRAKDIPQILKEALCFPFDPKMEKDYNSYRDIRNNIAHGKPPTDLSLRKVQEMYSTLITLAKKIDEHIISYFFVIERLK